MAKILTVFGATGNQGGSVVQSVLSNPELSKTYKVRAVTRDPSKPAAQKLSEQGAEVVKGDQSDLESVKAAVKGSYAVFGVTQFWEHFSGEKEEEQGRAMADACLAEGVTFFILSSLPSPKRVTNGRLTHVKHFEGKANVETYVRTLPIKSAFYWAGYYMSNYDSVFPPQKGDDGVYTHTASLAPDNKIPLLAAAEDTGKFITPLLLDPESWNHKRIYGATAFYTCQEIADTFSKVLGKTFKHNEVSDEKYAEILPPAMSKEMGENFILVREYEYFGNDGKGAEAELERSVKAVEAAGLKLTSFEEFVKNQKYSWL